MDAHIGYTPAELARALARVKPHPMGRVTRVEVGLGADGGCMVTLMDERRDPTPDTGTHIRLTADETRAWRRECRRIASERSSAGR